MNKTNYIILTLILCFSIAFVAHPIKTNALIPSNDVTDIKDEDLGSEPDPGDVEIGDTFTGPSGTEYELEDENLSPEEEAYYNESGLSADGVWVEKEEGERKKYKYKVCTTGAGCVEAGRCVNTSTYKKNKADECQSDADCGPPPVSPPSNGDTPSNGWAPSSNGDAPSNGDTPSNGWAPSSNGDTPSNGWEPPAGPPPTLPETQPCMINYFELPERAWVDYPITGRWSAGAWCDDCDVDCTPYPECVWKQDSIGTGFDEYKFTLEQPGTYNYTLTCYGEGGIDERTETATVEALNLPWWREIIPVLQGFLRGISK